MRGGGDARAPRRPQPGDEARGSRRTVVAWVAAAACLAACASPDVPREDVEERVTSDAAAAYEPTSDLPPGAPPRFGFGREATAERVARWDIDVRPDGTGLPPGSGTVEEGRRVYEVHCVACHGPTGVEGPNDRLVDTRPWDPHPPSRAVGSYWPHATTLYDFVRKAMPQLTPGILNHDEVYAVVAYILHLNQIVPEDAVMDSETLPRVRMPARDRFVVDDRTGGPGPVR